jgi:hypothetical protein
MKKWTKLVLQLSTILTAIGAIVWGLVGLFHFNLVQAILGSGFWADAIYTIIGVSGLIVVAKLIKLLK